MKPILVDDQVLDALCHLYPLQQVIDRLDGLLRLVHLPRPRHPLLHRHRRPRLRFLYIDFADLVVDVCATEPKNNRQ